MVLIIGGVSFAAYRYDAAAATRLMPGITIGGVDVGEMSREDAIAALDREARERLSRDIQISAGQRTWSVSAAELGTVAVVEPVVDRALRAADGYSWPERVFRRTFDNGVSYSADIRFRPDMERIRSYMNRVAEQISTEPTNAKVSYEEGELVLRRPEAGLQVPVNDARRAMRRGLAGGSETVQLPVTKLKPEVRRDDLGHTIVVDLSNLELSLYDGLRLDRTYPVAAGSPSYPTPQGRWEVINKAENPTWTNPAPDGWGKDLPLQIAGGPSNPLGTRALYLNAPGIRIHGTPASYSIGSYASHGCVRMLMEDVEELYEIVPIGTIVHVVP